MAQRAKKGSVARFALAAGLVVAACQHGRAPFATTAAADAPRARDAGTDAQLLHVTPPPLPPQDAPGVCGRTIVPIALTPVNLYFIVDASGSMSTQIDSPDSNGGIQSSRFDAARIAIRDLLLTVGSRVSFGAALFPLNSSDPNDACAPGGEVFPTHPGDGVSYTKSATPGPELAGLLRILGAHKPSGLTPTAVSIAAVKTDLLALPGKTYAFLLTDGAPNCDAAATCDASTCTVNIEGSCGQPPSVNCCDPALGLYDARWCLDADPTVAAVKDLADSGIETFIIGMPGTEAYANLLNRVAEAGGTARPSDPEYYAVEDSTDLSTTLQSIGLSVAISCDISLEQAPPDREQVNVYFDGMVIPLDAQDGWTWTGDANLSIVGSSCEELQTGRIQQVQVIAGCPSVTR